MYLKGLICTECHPPPSTNSPAMVGMEVVILITLRRLNIGTIIGNQLGVQMLNDIKKNVDKFLFEDDIKTRNELALKLCENQSDESYEAICTVIKRDISKNIGTLVYCLGLFPPEKSFLLLIDVICSGNFESANSAMDIIENIEYLDGDIAAKGFELLYEKQDYVHIML